MTQKPNDLISVDELSEIVHPFLGTRIGKMLGRAFLKRIRVDTLNELHKKYSHLRGCEFTSAILRDPAVAVSYQVHGMEHLEALKSKTFITVSNHPFGGLDGLMLIDVVARVRPDLKVLVNGILNRISALSDNWIAVQPRKNKKSYVHEPEKNVSGIRLLADQLQEGHPVSMFPAGGVSKYDFRNKRIKEQIWQLNSTRIIKAAKLPVLPVMFSGQNSMKFYRLLRLSYNLNVLRLPLEILNKKGKVFDIYIGAPIQPEEYSKFKTLKELRDFLMQSSLALLPEYQ